MSLLCVIFCLWIAWPDVNVGFISPGLSSRHFLVLDIRILVSLEPEKDEDERVFIRAFLTHLSITARMITMTRSNPLKTPKPMARYRYKSVSSLMTTT